MTRTAAVLLALLTAATADPASAQASQAQQRAALAYLKSGQEPRVKDATWTSARMLKVGVLSDGSNRDGFASYVCSVLTDQRITGASVQVIDVAHLVRTGKWVKLGEARCD